MEGNTNYVITSGCEDICHPQGKWDFDEEVTQCFDDMLARSIPQYEVMRDAVTKLACRFIDIDRSFPLIVDIGSSRGEAIDGIYQMYQNACQYICIETSEPMVHTLQARYGANHNFRIYNKDLRYWWLRETGISVMLSILTIQFIPIEYRQSIIQNIYNSLAHGGAFIFVEKVLGSDAQIDTIMVDEYYKLKETNGYSREDIDRKKLSLEGVLVPVTSHWNEELLQKAGFKRIDCFWRWMNFAGFIAIKE